MQAPLIQGMGSTPDEEAQKTSCETHVCLLCPDDTPLTCPESACCHADLADPAPEPRSGYFACCLNAVLPGFGTCTVGCLKGSRRAKCAGFLTMVVATATAIIGSNMVIISQSSGRDKDLLAPGVCFLILFGIVYTCTCAWSSSIMGFLSRKPGEPREPALKFMTTVPTVNPCEAVFCGVLNCLVSGVGAISAGAVGTENRAYGIKAGGYQMLLSTAPFLVMVMIQIALFSSAASGDVQKTQIFMGLSPLPFTLAIACYALSWLWSCLYGYLLIKHNTQLCSHFDALATPTLPVATAAGISRPTSPNGSHRGVE